MLEPVEHLTWATVFRLTANLLTVVSAFAWLRFADVREGHLGTPSLHHKVYLRLLIGLSVCSMLSFVLSLAATVGGAGR